MLTHSSKSLLCCVTASQVVSTEDFIHICACTCLSVSVCSTSVSASQQADLAREIATVDQIRPSPLEHFVTFFCSSQFHEFRADHNSMRLQQRAQDAKGEAYAGRRGRKGAKQGGRIDGHARIRARLSARECLYGPRTTKTTSCSPSGSC